ncbi:hypothetical protein Tco_0316262 [Tanacetum coccineum]
MNDHLKAQQVLNDSMSKLREMFQTWLQQRQEQVVNLDTYTPEPSQCQKIPICYDDDDDEYSFATQEYLKKFSSAITPDLPKSDSLIIEDKHLDTILEPESDELIKSSVEDLVHTLSESDGISESECDLPVCDDSSPKKDEVLDDIISIPPGNDNDHFNAESSLIESMLNRDNVISSPKINFLLEEFAGELALIAPIPSGIVEADFDPKGDIRFIENLIDDIDYVEASPPDSELVSLEVVEIVIPEVGGIDTAILLTIKDDILREKLLNVNLLIAKIKALKDNPTPSSNFVTKSSSTALNFFLEETNTFDNSLPESETFCFNMEEISSGSPTSYLDLSLPDYEALEISCSTSEKFRAPYHFYTRARVTSNCQNSRYFPIKGLEAISRVADKAFCIVLRATTLLFRIHYLIEISDMDPYEKVAQQGQAHPLSPTYVPDPMELDEHVLVYVPEPEHPEYHAPLDDDIQIEDHPYADDASLAAESPGYIADSDTMEEDTNEDSIDYPEEPRILLIIVKLEFRPKPIKTLLEPIVADKAFCIVLRATTLLFRIHYLIFGVMSLVHFVIHFCDIVFVALLQVNKVQVTDSLDGRHLKSHYHKDLHALHFGILLCCTGYSLKDEKQSLNNKTKHENGKSVKKSQQSQQGQNQVKVNPEKWHWKEHRKPNQKT